MFPHRNIHKYTWTFPDGKTHNQIDHVLIDRRWHSSVLDVRSFRGAECDIYHYLVIVKVRERLAVGKQAAQRLDRHRQAEIHTAEPLVPELNAFEVELAIGMLKSHKSPGIEEIPAELIKAGGGTICGKILKLITSIWKKEKLSEEWEESIIVPIHKKGDKTDCNNYRGISFAEHLQNFIQHLALKVNSMFEGNYRGSSMWLSAQQVDY